MLKLLWILVAMLFTVPSAAAAEDVVVGEYKTSFRASGSDSPRAWNVRLAASKVDGVVVESGEMFSYNGTVGPRSEDRGFRVAHVIEQGKLVDGVGGGACQVASTLAAAVRYSGLEIIEAHPHSLASAYIQPGLDATVAMTAGSEVDFKFRNNFQRPVTIRAEILPTEKGRATLVIRLVSDTPIKRVVKVKFEVSKIKRRPVWKILSRQVKSPHVEQAGSNGMDVIRHYLVEDEITGEVLINQVSRFVFKPLPRIILVPR